jgi:hypothetical protein
VLPGIKDTIREEKDEFIKFKQATGNTRTHANQAD